MPCHPKKKTRAQEASRGAIDAKYYNGSQDQKPVGWPANHGQFFGNNGWMQNPAEYGFFMPGRRYWNECVNEWNKNSHLLIEEKYMFFL